MKFILYPLVIIAFVMQRCTSQPQKNLEETHAYTNDLIHETSPYLLQHAHNPVNWKPWNEKTLELAKKEDKLVLISVGYAACHWCHVMEHESFEDSIVAAVMNENFINIKVDREERPDVDQVYMTAVQLLTGSGGWPMNVIALPDGRPVWGGTYFPKGDWISTLKQFKKIKEKNPRKLTEAAEKLADGIHSAGLIEPNPNAIKFSQQTIDEGVKSWSSSFDHVKGGTKRVPKFMMPNNYHFLLRYGLQKNDENLLEFVDKTLTKISFGGVYDHIGGGFSRYSTDAKWHIPHFEKMLYDNAQLVSLYSDAYLHFKNEWYKDVVYETLGFISREMTNTEGAFYSSLDADSLDEKNELEEGAFYVWEQDALKEALGNDFDLFKDYYNINSYGAWENNHYVLIRKESDQEITTKFKLSPAQLNAKINSWKKTLLTLREERPRPRLDDKTLTSWNALMLKAYVDAYRVFGDEKFLDIALKNAHFIKDKQLQANGALFHNYKNNSSTINGYLEDYAAVIQAYIALYENTLDYEWLTIAKKLTDYTLQHFFDTKSELFYFTSDLDAALVTRKIEYQDNVIPASNSIMAKNIYLLSHYFSNTEYLKISRKMLHNVQPELSNYPPGYSNWMDLMLNYSDKFYEVVIVGPKAKETIKNFNSVYYPNKLLVGSLSESQNPLFEGRFSEGETLIYICVNNACKYPVKTIKEALLLMK